MSATIDGERSAEFPRGNSPAESALNAAVLALEEHQHDRDEGLWKMAVVLARILNERLWEHRRGDDGRERHRSFKHFVVAETKLGYAHAIRLAHLAAHGAAAFAQHGLRKLYAVSSAPEHAQLGSMPVSMTVMSSLPTSCALRKEGYHAEVPR